jgi:hypothetical protein
MSLKAFKFTALKDFECPELRSHYAKGMTYTVRPGNHTLNALVEQWQGAGLVRVEEIEYTHVLGPVPSPTAVRGRGEVSDTVVKQQSLLERIKSWFN